jgi:beta-galactosidase
MATAVFFAGVRRRIGARRGETQGVRTHGTPRFDPLEPRLLLNADLAGSAQMSSSPIGLGERALVVDWEQGGQPVPETPAPLCRFEIGQPTSAAEGCGRVEGTVGPLSDAAPANLASGKAAVASTSYPGLPASNATDGNPASRWSSQFSDNEWIYVDLGSVCTIDRIVLRWETAYGRGYKVQVSDDASTWADVYSTTTGDGGVDDIVLGTPASGRYVRLLGTKRGTVYGYSLWEFEVYGGGGSANLALSGPASASTSYPGLPASNTTDGNPASRWSSQFSDNEWIYVDLGASFTIGRVMLRWETAYGRGYKIQVSADASTWSDVYATTTGDGGVDDLSLSASGRYVRMLGTQRATMYGYSLWEFEVYGAGGPTNHAPAVSSFSKSGTQDTPLPFAAADFAGAFTDPDAGDSLQKIKITSVPSRGVLRLNGTAVAVGQEIATAQIGTLMYTPNSTYTGSDSFQWNGSDGNLYAASDAAVNLSVNMTGVNLALHKPAVASMSYSGLPPSNATDGNVNSRWSSLFSDGQWIYVDLGSVLTIHRVVLRWEAAYGRGYKLQVSGDASTWSEVYSTTTGDGGVDEISLSSPALGRYLRMLGTQRATAYGYSLYELEVYGEGVRPEITVLGNDVSITDGDTTPSAADGTDFGSVAPGAPAISRTFTVRNDGNSALTLGVVTVPMGFYVIEGLSGSLAPGASDNFTVQLDTGVLGIKTGEISFTTNDSDENPFNFTITGTVGSSEVPEITVLGNGVSIADGDTTPSAGDGTDFGSVIQNDGPIQRDFTVRNDGTAPLSLGPVTVPTGFTLIEALSGYLPAGISDTFTVQLSTATAGTWTGDLSFWTTDRDEDPFNFTITGTVTAAGVPEVTVAVAPSEVAEDGATNLVYTFTRSTAGGSPLTVNFSVGGTATYGTDYAATGAVNFSAGSGTVTIAADQTTAAVTVDPAADTAVEPDETVILTVTAGIGYTIGAPAGSTGTIHNDDTVTNVALGRPATASTSYPGLPASNATDGSSASRWSSQFSDSQWIYVDLGAVHTIRQVVLRWETAYGRGYRLQVSSDAASWMDVYATTTGDGGTDDITLSSPLSGRYVRMLGTQRGTVYGYSLWEFEVYA